MIPARRSARAVRRPAGLALAAAMMLVGLVPFSMQVSRFEPARIAGDADRFTRTFGLPGSPWLSGRCEQVSQAPASGCVEWTWTLHHASRSWLALAVGLLGMLPCFSLLRHGSGPLLLAARGMRSRPGA